MIEFSDISVLHRQGAQELIKESKFISCECGFADQLIWSKPYSTQVAFEDGFYIVKYTLDGKNYLAMPMGNADIKSLLEKLKQLGLNTVLGATKDFVELLEKNNIDCAVKEDRAHFDYIYLAQKLATLSGKKLHSKRNHINKFKSLYNYSYRDLKDNIEDAMSINNQWCAQNGVCKENSVVNEKCAVKILFGNYDTLGVKGIVMYINDKPVAYTAGTALFEGSDMFITHFEKAIDGYEGAYAMINYLFANELSEKYMYINREDDMGIEGLRKAKLSYYPDILLEKYTVTF